MSFIKGTLFAASLALISSTSANAQIGPRGDFNEMTTYPLEMTQTSQGKTWKGQKATSSKQAAPFSRENSEDRNI